MPDNKRLVELALLGLRTERARIDQEISDLKKLLGKNESGGKHVSAGTRGPMSEAQKKAISLTMRKYWTRRRKQKAK